MIHLRRSAQLWAVPNKNGVQFREIATLAKTLFEMAKRRGEGSFNTVARNTIHGLYSDELGVMGEMGSLVYPGSLSTMSSTKESSFRTTKEIQLNRLINFDNHPRVKNKLSILLMKCPKLLFSSLKESCSLIQFFDDISIIQLSYERYHDREKGRKDCLIAANEIGRRLAKQNRWTHFSALSAPIQPDDEHLCLFKNGISEVNEDLAPKLHVEVVPIDSCVKISLPPFNDSVGIIYANVSDLMSNLKFLCTKDE